MMKTKWLAVICMFVCVAAGRAEAQTRYEEGRGFFTVSFGVQATSRSFTEVSTPLIYGEAAAITVPHSIGSGPLFDIAGGARVWRKLSVGLGYSRYSDKSRSTVTAL